MRNIVFSYFLLMVFGTSQVFSITQHFYIIRHKEGQAKMVHSKHHVSLKFSKKEWNKLIKVGNQELKINGRMFDISSMYTDGNNYFVAGHFDSKEDLLLEKASNEMGKKSELKKNSFSQNLLFFEEIHSFKLYQFLDIEKQTGTIQLKIFSQFIQSESPPPKFFI